MTDSFTHRTDAIDSGQATCGHPSPVINFGGDYPGERFMCALAFGHGSAHQKDVGDGLLPMRWIEADDSIRQAVQRGEAKGLRDAADRLDGEAHRLPVLGAFAAKFRDRADRLTAHNGPALEAGPLAGAGTNPLVTSSTDAAQRSAKLSQTFHPAADPHRHVVHVATYDATVTDRTDATDAEFEARLERLDRLEVADEDTVTRLGRVVADTSEQWGIRIGDHRAEDIARAAIAALKPEPGTDSSGHPDAYFAGVARGVEISRGSWEEGRRAEANLRALAGPPPDGGDVR